jgi:hypothetical protein
MLNRNAIISLAEARNFIFQDTTKTLNSDFIAQLVNSVSAQVEQHTGRRFRAADVTEFYNGSGDSEPLFLPLFPIQNVATLWDDGERNFNTVDEISVTTNVIVSEAEGYIELFNEYSAFSRGKRNVKINYRGGYEPFDIRANENDTIDFKAASSSTLVATLAPAHYESVNSFASHLETRMNLVASANATLDVEYIHASGEFGISTRGAQTLEFLFSSGSNSARSAAKVLGWPGNSDVTGVTDHRSESKVWPVPEDLKLAVAMQVAHNYNKSRKTGGTGQLGKTSRSQSAVSTTYGPEGPFLPEVARIVNAYKPVKI